MTDPTTPPDPAATTAAAERRRRLLGVQLRAVVGEHLGETGLPEPEEFAPGAALTVGRTGWLLVDGDPTRQTGRCLAWMLRHEVDELNVVATVADGAGTVARRLGEFDLPTAVWAVDGRQLDPVASLPIPTVPAVRDDHRAFDELITAAGAQPAAEHGVVTGEVRGLEVCRVVDDPVTGAVRLEVGVGAHDREVFAMVHGDVPTIDALRGVVASVLEHRTATTGAHPINRVAPERFVRWRLTEEPTLIDATAVAVSEPPIARTNLKDPEPAAATGAVGGVGTAVACSTGVVLDLVPFAADHRLASGLDELVIVVPERDRTRITSDLVACLRRPARLVSAPAAATALTW